MNGRTRATNAQRGALLTELLSRARRRLEQMLPVDEPVQADSGRWYVNRSTRASDAPMLHRIRYTQEHDDQGNLVTRTSYQELLLLRPQFELSRHFARDLPSLRAWCGEPGISLHAGTTRLTQLVEETPLPVRGARRSGVTTPERQKVRGLLPRTFWRRSGQTRP